jgi:hypothetical protein
MLLVIPMTPFSFFTARGDLGIPFKLKQHVVSDEIIASCLRRSCHLTSPLNFNASIRSLLDSPQTK